MGSAKSKNVIDTTTEVITNVSSSLIQKSDSTISQKVDISVVGGTGNLQINGNVFNQEAKINTEQLLKALNSQEAQNKIIKEVKQAAESVTSGLNLGNSSESSNIVESYMSAVINISSNIEQYCTNRIGQEITILVDRRDGNIEVNNNTFNQLASNFSKCIGDVVSNQKAIQDVQEKFDQLAVSKSEGLNLWAVALILFMVALIIMAVFIGPAIGGAKIVYTVLQFLFPVMFILGGVFIAIYYIRTQYVMRGDGYSRGLSNAPICKVGGKTSPTTIYNNVAEASAACQARDDCVALDWDPTKPPSTFFYKSIGNPNCTYQVLPEKNPNPVEFGVPILTVSVLPPINPKFNDMYLNPSNGDYFRKDNSVTATWPVIREGNFYGDIGISPDGLTIRSQLGGSCDATYTGYTIIYGINPTKMDVWRSDGTSCFTQTNKSEEPYQISITPRPEVPGTDTIPWSGIKVTRRNNTWLFLGIAFLIIGLIGTAIAFYMASKSGKSDKLIPDKLADLKNVSKKGNLPPTKK